MHYLTIPSYTLAVAQYSPKYTTVKAPKAPTVHPRNSFASPLSRIHISVAFPMLTKLLRILLNGDAKLFLLCTVGAFGAFTAVYLGLYRATARVYEGIVR